jgi:hypothetical protein
VSVSSTAKKAGRSNATPMSTPCQPLLILLLMAIMAPATPLDGVNRTLLQCVYSQQHTLMIQCGQRPAFVGDANESDCRTPIRRLPNHCGHHWLGAYLGEVLQDPAALEGIPEVRFVGDSTLMRTYMFVLNASAGNYTKRVAQLSDDGLNATILLPSGRNLPVHFHRSLHIALAAPLVRSVLNVSAPRALVVLAYGPHDTSWLVFRRPMPYFHAKNVGKFSAAEAYWRKHSTYLAMHVAAELRQRPAAKRPVVVVREHFLANCRHVKYSKYPLITRCKDLLNPQVIPTYRAYMIASFALLNVPTVGIDGLFPPCYMEDAGHISRKCKAAEVQLLVQAYHDIVRAAGSQGGLGDLRSVNAALTAMSAYHRLRESFVANITQPWDGRTQGANTFLPTNTAVPPSRTVTRAFIRDIQSTVGTSKVIPFVQHGAAGASSQVGGTILVGFGLLFFAVVLYWSLNAR